MPPPDRSLTKSMSTSALIAPPSVGDHVYRVQFRAASGKLLGAEITHLLSAKADMAGPDNVFEVHRMADGKYAIRSALGKFLNVDDNIDLCVREKTSKDLGLKADRDGGAVGPDGQLANLSDREKSFQIVDVPPAAAGGAIGNRIALRAPDDYFIAVEPTETKTKVSKNAVAAAMTAAAAASASPAASASSTAASSSSSSAAAAVPSSPSPPSLGLGQGPPRPIDFQLTPAQLFEPVWLDDRSPLTLQGRVIIKTAHDKLWCAEPGGGVVANRRCVSLWEPLVLVPHSLTHVAFLSPAHGTFLSLLGSNNNGNSGNGNGNGSASNQQPPNSSQSQSQNQSPTAGGPPQPPQQQLSSSLSQLGFVSTSGPSASELFQVVEIDRFTGLYGFVAPNGRFVTAQGNHQLAAAAKQLGPWERFQVTQWGQDVV